MAMRRWMVVGVGLLVVLALAPVWAAYGALTPGGDHGEMEVHAEAFMGRNAAYAARHRLPDGSVMAVPDEPVPIVVMQFGFQPNVVRMRTGETYTLEMAAKDVTHGFSLQLGSGSLNAVAMPGSLAMLEVTPLQPGEYLFLCNEYCGIGHQIMSGKLVVEGPPSAPGQAPAPAPEEHRGGH